MLRTTSKPVIQKIRAYIVDGVDLDYFDLDEKPDFQTACKLVLSACENEKRYINYRSDFERFKDWAQGLPTAFDTMYFYNVSAVGLLAEWLEETDSEKARFDESEAEEKITWLLFRELMKGGGKK
jgi:hypothetical protein